MNMFLKNKMRRDYFCEGIILGSKHLIPQNGEYFVSVGIPGHYQVKWGTVSFLKMRMTCKS